MAAELWILDDSRVGDVELRAEIGEPVAAVERIVEFHVGLLGVQSQKLELVGFFRRIFLVVVFIFSIGVIQTV